MEVAFYRVSEFCRKYALSKSTLYREVRAGRLLLVKRGRSTLISRSDAERWVAGLHRQQTGFDTAGFAQIIQASFSEQPAPRSSCFADNPVSNESV